MKYTSTVPAPVEPIVEAQKAGSKVGAAVTAGGAGKGGKEVVKRVKDLKRVVGEDSVVRARGKAWAMEFRDGEFQFAFAYGLAMFWNGDWRGASVTCKGRGRGRGRGRAE